MQEAEHQRKDTSFDEFGDDGELSDAIFCTDCGSLNDVGAEVCKSCGSVLAEQGNHLSARLRRISRRANSTQVHNDTSTDVLGEIWVSESKAARKVFVKSRRQPIAHQHETPQAINWPLVLGILFFGIVTAILLAYLPDLLNLIF